MGISPSSETHALSETELRRLCARSATLSERLAGQVVAPIATDESTLQGRLAQWAREVERPDAGFSTYLKLCGFSHADARRAAHDYEWTGELPAWAAHADGVLVAGDQAAAQRADGCDARPAAVLAEAVAGEVVRRSPVPLADGVLTEWTRALSERLSSFADPILATEAWVEQSFGDAPGCPREFEAARWKSALLRRPALLRAFCVALHHAQQAADEALERLGCDHPALHRAFGGEWTRLTGFSAPLSDLHRGGRAVHRLEFDGGAAVFYKPRSLRAEAVFLAAARESYGLPTADPPVVLDRKTHGWMLPLVEAIPTSAAEARQFCSRLGALLSLAHRTGTTDLHRGNIVFTADGPLPVDAETVMHPVLDDAWFKEETGGVSFRWAASLLRTHLLECHLHLEGGRRPIWGILPSARNSHDPTWEILLRETDQSWREAVIEGFRSHEANVCRRPEHLGRLRRALLQCPRRAVRCDTAIYLDVLAASLQDPWLSDGFHRSIRLEGIFRTADAPDVVLPDERGSLVDLDVPALSAAAIPERVLRLCQADEPADQLVHLLTAPPVLRVLRKNLSLRPQKSVLAK